MSKKGKARQRQKQLQERSKSRNAQRKIRYSQEAGEQRHQKFLVAVLEDGGNGNGKVSDHGGKKLTNRQKKRKALGKPVNGKASTYDHFGNSSRKSSSLYSGFSSGFWQW